MSSSKVLNKGTWRNNKNNNNKNNDEKVIIRNDDINNNNDATTISSSLIITTLEEQLEKLYNDFKYLDSVLHTLNNRHEIGIFSKVKEGVEQLSSLTFTIEDMSIILLIFPKSFHIIWKEMPIMNYETKMKTNTMSMCILSSNEWINDYTTITSSTSSNTNTTDNNNNNNNNDNNNQLIRPTIKNRLKYFKIILNNIKESRKGCTDMIKPDLSILPTKPDISLIIDKKQVEALELAKIAKEKKRKLLSIADEELKEIDNEGNNGLESIRKLAEKRQKMQQENDDKKNEDKKKIEMNTRLKSLPTLCDTLRSLCRSTNRNIRPLNELINILAPDLRLQPKELYQRLLLLHDIAPEFINILPPDNLVNVTTIRINLDCPYGYLRTKICKQSSTI